MTGTIGTLHEKRARCSSSRQTLDWSSGLLVSPASRTAWGLSRATTSWVLRRPSSISRMKSVPARIFRRIAPNIITEDGEVLIKAVGQPLGITPTVAEEEPRFGTRGRGRRRIGGRPRSPLVLAIVTGPVIPRLAEVDLGRAALRTGGRKIAHHKWPRRCIDSGSTSSRIGFRGCPPAHSRCGRRCGGR